MSKHTEFKVGDLVYIWVRDALENEIRRATRAHWGLCQIVDHKGGGNWYSVYSFKQDKIIASKYEELAVYDESVFS